MTIGVTPLDGVAVALGLGSHEHVALVGGGGKTTLLHALAHQLTGTRLLTTTTRMGANQTWGLPLLLDPDDDAVAAVAATPDRVAMVWRAVEGAKARGVAPERCDHWFTAALIDGAPVDHVLVEADGSKHLPFKAPAPFEPVIPATATVVVAVMGADALGRVIFDRCHRPLRVAALAGCPATVRLTPEAAARVLLHPRGFLRAVPPGARYVVAVTRVDTADPALAADLAALVATLEATVPVVMVGHDPRPRPWS